MKIFCTTILFLFIANVFSQEQFSVFFNSNKFDLKKSEIIRLNKWLLNNKDSKIVGVYGYCDEDGTEIFNDSLAKKRIETVFKLIKTKIKFREDFKTRNFGELNNKSKIKAENRKVTLFYILPKDLGRENEILGIKKIEIIAPIVKYDKIKFPDSMFFENRDGSKTEMKLDTVFMQQINTAKAGEKLKLQNLNFIINTFAVVNESRPKLYELLLVMKNNPKIKIEIQGNLCCARNDKQDLSTQRAKAIFSFLVNQNIDKSRLTYKGFGVSQPLFAIPEKDENERAANRRVEILIVEN